MPLTDPIDPQVYYISQLGRQRDEGEQRRKVLVGVL